MSVPLTDSPVLLYDGACVLCDAAVQFVLEHERDDRFRFASLQSDVGRQLAEACGAGRPLPASLIVVDHGRCLLRSDAALFVADHLNAPWSWAAAGRWVPRPVRDLVYDVVARNRYRWFGVRDECRLPTPDLRARFLDAAESLSTTAGS